VNSTKATTTRTIEYSPAGVQAEANLVGEAMSNEWIIKTNPTHCWGFQLHHKSGIVLFVHVSQAPKKYQVSVSWPCGRDGRVYIPNNPKKIKVTFQRGPKALADAIEKCLMPYAREEWAKMLTKIEKDNKREDERKASVKKLAKQMNTTTSQNFPFEVWGLGTSGINKIEVHSSGKYANVKLDYSLPIEFVEKLIDFCKENYKDELSIGED